MKQYQIGAQVQYDLINGAIHLEDQCSLCAIKMFYLSDSLCLQLPLMKMPSLSQLSSFQLLDINLGLKEMENH
jgi:hypothetical protein